MSLKMVTFDLVNPLDSSMHPNERGPDAKGLTLMEAARVLIVDDNRDVMQTLATLMHIQGCEVEVAGSGLEALELGRVFEPQIILMDLGMPFMDGYQAVARIRNELWGRQARIVALTGWGQDEDRQKTREAGFDLHLVKPVTSRDLKSLLAAL